MKKKGFGVLKNILPVTLGAIISLLLVMAFFMSQFTCQKKSLLDYTSEKNEDPFYNYLDQCEFEENNGHYLVIRGWAVDLESFYAGFNYGTDSNIFGYEDNAGFALVNGKDVYVLKTRTFVKKGVNEVMAQVLGQKNVTDYKNSDIESVVNLDFGGIEDPSGYENGIIYSRRDEKPILVMTEESVPEK